MMKKILILSGKGGTGKTTTAAALIQFSKANAIADCDVDAPNLHLVSDLDTKPESSIFLGSDKAHIDPNKCVGCGICATHCNFDAIAKTADGSYQVNEYTCEGCGICAYVCQAKAVSIEEDEAGIKELYKGTKVFSTATLKMGRGNSGKLVTAVKKDMEKAADKEGVAIIDGSPGIGCPVIASISGVDLVLLVAEPTLSGLSDLKRVLKIASNLRTKVVVCVNKYDISVEKTEEIQHYCEKQRVPFVGKVPYDKRASKAMNEGSSLGSFEGPAKAALYEVYKKTFEVLNSLQ